MAQGLADVHVPLSRPPCDTYKVVGAAAWAAAGPRTPKASTAPAPSAVAAYRPARMRAQKPARIFMNNPPLATNDRFGQGSRLTLSEARTVGAAPHLRRCALSAFFALIPCLPLWFAVPPRWRSSRPSLRPAGTRQQGPDGPIGHGGCGPIGPIHHRDAGHIGAERGRLSGGRGDRVDAGLEDVADQFCPAPGAGLVPDPLQVRPDRVDRQDQPPGDLGVGRATDQQRDDLPLSVRQRAS